MTYVAKQAAEEANEVTRFESMGTALEFTAKAAMPNTNGMEMNFMVCYCYRDSVLESGDLKRAEVKNKKRKRCLKRIREAIRLIHDMNTVK